MERGQETQQGSGFVCPKSCPAQLGLELLTPPTPQLNS